MRKHSVDASPHYMSFKTIKNVTVRGAPRFVHDNRDLKHVGRQHDDDGQNKFLQINDSKENLSYIIIRMNLIQYKKLKTLALCLGRVLLNRILSCTCYGLKFRRCIKDV